MAKDPIKTLEALEKKLDKRVSGILWRNVTRVRDRLKNNLLAGGALQKRTKGLPVVRVRPTLAGSLITAGVRSPVEWAKVHFGPKGSTVTISPKKGRYLALPTDFVKTYRGHPVSPKRYSGTFVRHGIIFGLAGWHGSSGLRQHRAAGERFGKKTAIPLFILKGSVVIKRRIDPQDLIAWIKPQFMADLKREALIP